MLHEIRWVFHGKTHGGDKMVNQIVAAVLSFIIPGLGQITAGETKKD